MTDRQALSAAKQEQIDYYEELLARHGANHKALDWNSPESQRLRFKILKEIFVYGQKASGITVLDVGCGLGDLYGFFKAEGLLSRHRISYTGCDISAGLVSAARKKYPDARFEQKDILEDKYVPKFDYVFCSGVFNVRTLEELDHPDFVKEMLFRMYDLAGVGAAINFLSEGRLPAAAKAPAPYFFFNPEEMAKFSRLVCGRFILRHDYHPGDFTLYLLK